jgi:hypothetical protein
MQQTEKIKFREMQQMSTKMQQQLEWRRNQVFELSSKGHSQAEIARMLQLDKSIISRDVAYLRQQSKDNIRKYIDERLPEEYEKCLVGLTAILREAWITSQHTEDKREKIQALSLAKDCYSMKLDLLTNATVVDDAIRFISSSSSSKPKEVEQQQASVVVKSKANDIVVKDKSKEEEDFDIQRSEEENKQQQSENFTTTNKTF